MGHAGTPVPEVVERLKLEILRLWRELHTILEDSIYVSMNANEYRAYEEKCKKLKRLTQELQELVRLQENAVISPPAASPDLPPLNPLKPPKNAP